jgi:hypothetical protein
MNFVLLSEFVGCYIDGFYDIICYLLCYSLNSEIAISLIYRPISLSVYGINLHHRENIKS